MYSGGLIYLIFCGLIVGFVMRELVQLTISDVPDWFHWVFGLVSGVTFCIISEVYLFTIIAVICCIGLPVFSACVMRGKRLEFAIYGSAVFLAAYQFVLIRLQLDLDYSLIIIGIVIATDIAGFIFGKFIGGPRLVPRISYQKRWSGAIAGWIVSVLGCLLLLDVLSISDEITILSIQNVLIVVGISVSSQLGDIAQSWLKRRAGVKDSSNIIPGHGGMFDRFDSMIGVGVAISFIELITILI